MAEEISRLMDGELDDGVKDVAWARLSHRDGRETWECYHMIGDVLRGTEVTGQRLSPRFSARLALEPTVLAPQRPAARPATFAWATAAGVAAVALVGWVAFGSLQTQPAALAKAGEAATIRPAQFAARAIPADYVNAHQELMPQAQVQANGPHLRSVAAPGPATQP